MTSEKRRLIGEVAPCPPPTTSSTLHLLFPLVPAPPPHTALSSPRKVRKPDQRSVRPSVRSRLWKVNEWLIWFARAGEGTKVYKLLPALVSSAVPACYSSAAPNLSAAPFGMRSWWRQRSGVVELKAAVSLACELRLLVISFSLPVRLLACLVNLPVAV